jgi:hypothetical protein
MAYLERQMRLETVSWVTIVVIAAVGFAGDFVIGVTRNVDLLVPWLAATLLAFIGAAVAWITGYRRSERALAKYETERRRRPPLSKIAVALTPAALVGAGYLPFPRWIQFGLTVLGFVSLAWVVITQRRGRWRRGRRSHRASTAARARRPGG